MKDAEFMSMGRIRNVCPPGKEKTPHGLYSAGSTACHTGVLTVGTHRPQGVCSLSGDGVDTWVLTQAGATIVPGGGMLTRRDMFA